MDALILRRVGGVLQRGTALEFLLIVAVGQFLRQDGAQKFALLRSLNGLLQRGGQHFQPKALGLVRAEQVLIHRLL